MSNQAVSTDAITSALRKRVGRGHVADKMMLVAKGDSEVEITSSTTLKAYAPDEIVWSWELNPYFDSDLPENQQARDYPTVIGYNFHPNVILVDEEYEEAVRELHADDPEAIAPEIYTIGQEAEGYARYIREHATRHSQPA